MAGSACGTEQMLVGLLTASHLMPLEELPAKVAQYAPAAGLLRVDIYMSDSRRVCCAG